MKLADVFGAFNTWKILVQTKLPPKIAYRVMKYSRLLVKEYELIEKARVSLVHELTNTLPNQDAAIPPEDMNLYIERFSELLDVESDLKPCDLKLSDLVDSLSNGDVAILSAGEIGSLEPFFTE